MLQSIYNILNRYKINWFIDSGSLLGVVREGDFLKWDRGIDISVLISSKNEFDNLQLAAEEIKELGFYCSRYLWGDKVYKYVLTTTNTKRFEYNLDLHIFVLGNDNTFMCPQVSFRPAPNFKKKLHKYFLAIKEGDPIYIEKRNFALTRFAVKKFYRFLLGHKIINLNLKPYVPVDADVFLWTIPCEFLSSFTFLKGHRIPEKPEKYLSYRYGDWTKPNPNWNFMEDDGSIRKSNEKNVEELSMKYYRINV